MLALITGATGGIGLELSKIAAVNGVNLVLVARSAENLKKVKEDIESLFPVKVTIYPVDLSVINSCERFVNHLIEHDMIPDILINNAGFGDYGKYWETSWEKELSMINLNIIALSEITKKILPHMIKKGSGRILNLASIAAFMPGPMMTTYYASKAFVLSYSQALNEELKGTGITVTCLCPGPVATGFELASGLEATKLFKRMPVTNPMSVAKYGYCAMMRGQAIAIHGILYRILLFSLRFIPSNWVVSIVKKISI